MRNADREQWPVMASLTPWHGQRCSAGERDITDSERRRCREASGGPGQHSAAARLCGEGVWSLETMGGVELPQDHTQRGGEPL